MKLTRTAIGAFAAIGLVAIASSLMGCATLSGKDRLGMSASGCTHNAVRALPAGLTDKQSHCVATGLIARHCSVSEAYLAGMSKEIRDLFGRGDAEWADIRADRAGIACARKITSDAQILGCCDAQLSPATAQP